MAELAPLSQSFFARPALDVARDLIGCIFLFNGCSGRIVETEAYTGDDPSSHAFRGETARNAVMFGPPGRLYVYFVYGMHFCANISCEDEGAGAAVLLRALEPLDGLAEMAARRGTDDLRLLCSGPARLAQALGITLAANGAPLTPGAGAPQPAADNPAFPRQALVLASPAHVAVPAIAAAPRIGVRDDGRLWRFLEADSAFVSRPAPRAAAGSVRRRRRSATVSPSSAGVESRARQRPAKGTT